VRRPTPDCDRARGLVSLMLDGEISELERLGLEAHARDCAACAGFQVEAADLAAAVRAAPLDRPCRPLWIGRARHRHGLGRALLVAASLAAASGFGAFVAGAGHNPVVIHAPPPLLVAQRPSLARELLLFHTQRQDRPISRARWSRNRMLV
jgi:hypothetical protein